MKLKPIALDTNSVQSPISQSSPVSLEAEIIEVIIRRAQHAGQALGEDLYKAIRHEIALYRCKNWQEYNYLLNQLEAHLQTKQRIQKWEIDDLHEWMEMEVCDIDISDTNEQIRENRERGESHSVPKICVRN